MESGLKRDVKKDVIPNMTSEYWSPVACWLLFTSYKYLTNMIYSYSLSML